MSVRNGPDLDSAVEDFLFGGFFLKFAFPFEVWPIKRAQMSSSDDLQPDINEDFLMLFYIYIKKLLQNSTYN